MSKVHLLNCNVSKIQRLYEYLLLLVYNELTRVKPRRLFLYVIGSIAKNEISCLELENNDAEKLVISDLDLIALTDLTSFIKCKLLNCTKIADVITNTLRQKGIETHVSLTLTWPALYKLLRFFKFNTVNFYEMKKVKCSNINKRCHIIEKTKEPVINLEDALNLVISSIADYIFVAINDVRINEAMYIISKRVLSLLYALELSLGLTPKGFTEVPLVAENNFEIVSNIVERNELKLLYTMANFKRSCDLNYLKQSIRNLGYNISSDNDLLQFLLKLFERYVRKVLPYFGNNINNSNMFKFINEFEQSRKEQKLMTVFLNLLILSLNHLILRGNRCRDVIELIIMFRRKLRLSDFLRILVLKFLTIILYRGRKEVASSTKLKDIGHNIVHLWYEYMI